MLLFIHRTVSVDIGVQSYIVQDPPPTHSSTDGFVVLRAHRGARANEEMLDCVCFYLTFFFSAGERE